MPINSRRKGKVGEQEFANLLKDYGYTARRGQQFKGGTGSPDVVCDELDWLHFEVKRVQGSKQVYEWVGQAMRDCGDNVPIVAHRRNGEGWLAILPLEELLGMIEVVQKAKEKLR